MAAVGVFVYENKACKVVFSRFGEDTGIPTHICTASHVADAAGSRGPKGVVGAVADVGQLNVISKAVFGAPGEALNDVVNAMLELDDLASKSQRTFARAVATKPLSANPEAGFAVDVVHGDLVGMFGDGQPHCFELSRNIGRRVGFLGGAAHAPFPLRVTQRYEVLSKGTGLRRVVIDEIVLVIG